MAREWRFALVLGGGGLRGLATVGAMRALESRGLVPDEVIGSSIGALVAATWAAGFTIREMESIALSLRRRDVFAMARADMALKRMRSPSLYKAEPLEELVTGLLGDTTFRELPRKVIVGSVEINSGTQIFWGLPGLDHVRVADAVFASCALPGFFPPREIDGRYWVDGAVVDNLPVRLAASHGLDAIVAVDVGSVSVQRSDTHQEGFAAVSARALEIVMRQTMEWHLGEWTGPPMLLVQPRVAHVPMFSFNHTPELLSEGHRATETALERGYDALRRATGGIFPRRQIQLRVLRERCIGCGACVALAPAGYFRMADGKAVAREEPCEWSPIDGGFIRHCPTCAITADPVGAERASTSGASTGTAPEPA
jgi:NTE family protein